MTRSLVTYTSKNESCGFSSSTSNSHLKCPTHVQLDTRVRQTRWIKIVETPGRSSTGLCTDGIRALVLSRSLEPRIAPGSRLTASVARRYPGRGSESRMHSAGSESDQFSERSSAYYIGRTPFGSSCDEAKAVPSDLIGWGASVKVSTGSLAASYKCASPFTALSFSIASRA